MRNTRIRIALVAGALTVSAVTAESWRQRHELGLARAEIERGEYVAALGRLESLEATRVVPAGGGEGEFAYWLGVCRWRAGRRDAALAVLARVPEASEYGTRTASMMAVGLLEKGHWRAAEERLERALAHNEPGLDAIRGQLDQLYRMQARTEDAARLLRAGCSSGAIPSPHSAHCGGRNEGPRRLRPSARPWISASDWTRRTIGSGSAGRGSPP